MFGCFVPLIRAMNFPRSVISCSVSRSQQRGSPLEQMGSSCPFPDSGTLSTQLGLGRLLAKDDGWSFKAPPPVFGSIPLAQHPLAVSPLAQPPPSPQSIPAINSSTLLTPDTPEAQLHEVPSTYRLDPISPEISPAFAPPSSSKKCQLVWRQIPSGKNARL